MPNLTRLEQSKMNIEETFNWDNAPVIVNINGVTWLLGQESDEQLEWKDAIEWCKSVGGELPPREILLHCYMNDSIKQEFKSNLYWSSTEFGAGYAWFQGFSNGGQVYGDKDDSDYVRAVRRLAI
jgi:hypothetical protein